MNSEEKAKRDLAGLITWGQKLSVLTGSSIGRIKYRENDHLAFMTMCFLSKQFDHMKTILQIIPSKDAILIARSMIEGLCQLLWAANKPDELPLRWRAYSTIYDWRLLQERIEKGADVIDEDWVIVREKLLDHGKQYLKKKYRNIAFNVDSIIGDPFQNNWRDDQSIKDICKLVGADILYDKAYKQFSAWHHWDASGLAQAIRREEHKVYYSPLSESDADTAIGVGFQCLFETLKLADSHIGLELASDLKVIREGYLEWHKERGNLDY